MTLSIYEEIGCAAPIRTIQYHLKELEQRGHIERITARTGWRLKRDNEPSILSRAAQQREPARWLADRIGCDLSTAYRALNRYRLN